ncbi:MAG: mandelate racemase/muconate lactonizing enzyme family protein [Chloroflexota bacterium]
MKIDHIEAINLRYEYPQEDQFQYGGGICTARLTTIIKVHTDQGLVGLGSVYSHPGMVYLIVRDQLDPMLRGEDATDVEGIWEKMYGLTRWYGRKGAAMSALGGIDMALWDIRGKATGKPVWSLLGGEQDQCPAYASGLLWKKPEALAEEASGYIEAGYRRVKMRLARNEDYDTSAVRAVRQAIGSNNDVIIDASMRYHPALAKRMGNFLAEQRVFWYEEPFAPEDIDAYVGLRGHVDVPLAAGENEFGFQGFRELIRAKAVDIVQPDACRCGGITEVWRTAKYAQEHGLRFATHSWSDAIAIVANAHVVSAMPNGITVEIDQMNNPYVRDLLEEPLHVTDGHIRLSNRPGLGITLNDAMVERHRMNDPLTVPDGVYSDMFFGQDNFPRALPYSESD